MTNINLAGRRALVTGSSSGLGEAIAMALSTAGAALAVHYHTDRSAAEKVVDRIREQGGTAFAFGANVSVPGEVDELFAEVVSTLGGIDILVNNAGMDGKQSRCVDSDPQQWSRVLELDLEAPYYCTRLALKSMLAQGRGVILNITSVHEYIPWSGYSAYTSAKAGLSMFTRTVAQEVAGQGVRVLAIAPGAIRTPINASVWQDPQGLADLNRKIAMGRMGEPEEIASVAVFLASDLASYITGTTITVDGGMLLYPEFRHGG
ncbi:MAG TPA: 3-oxoacyl-ACP reductase FabG [Burkholderiales bacterium]|nr:3-oxoacyl-ACP reductase FabG [Burkholderiales bacterium]